MESCPFVASRGHQPMSQLFAQCRQRGANPRNFFSWAFVRHPFDRIRSVYYAFCQHHQAHCPPHTANSFAEFVIQLRANPEWVFRFAHLIPQAAWLNKEMLNEEITFIGRFEHIERDWKTVTNRIIGRDFPLSHQNSTDKTKYLADEQPETREIIKEIYMVDFEAYYPNS